MSGKICSFSVKEQARFTPHSQEPPPHGSRIQIVTQVRHADKEILRRAEQEYDNLVEGKEKQVVSTREPERPQTPPRQASGDWKKGKGAGSYNAGGKGGNGGGKGGDKGWKRKHDGSQAAAENVAKKQAGKCFKCGEYGHTRDQCKRWWL